jgi:hypothetical protein
MNIIKQNPFRILGLTGNATERELQKQLGKIKAFERVGKKVSLEYDFNFLGALIRNLDEIQQASNRIEQSHKKLLYSLFWFVKNTQFDEIAFNNLKERETDKAIEIWKKTLKEEITSKNYSSYLNLSTLYIALSTIDDQIELQQLQAGISLKGNLIHSENLKDFSKLVTGNGIASDPIEVSKKFVDEIIELLKPYLNKRNGISTNNLISLFGTFPTSIQKYVSAKFTDIPISSIENKIEKTIRKRKDNPGDAEEYGEELYNSTKTDVTLLKKLDGNNNLQFQMIANKLAKEILQCSIDFFNELRKEDGEFDPGDAALRIAKYAKSVGATGQALDRVNEAIESIQEWVDDKEEREKIKIIETDIEYILEELRLLNETDTYDRKDRAGYYDISFDYPSVFPDYEVKFDKTNLKKANKFITNCYPRIKNIEKKIGTNADTFLQLSSAIVNNTLGLIIEAVNNNQKIFAHPDPIARINSRFEFESLLETSVELIHIITSLVVYKELKVRLQTNKDIILEIANQFKISTQTRKEKNLNRLQNEMYQARSKMKSIQAWQLFRNEVIRKKEILEQEKVINTLLKEIKQEKASSIL